jgi:hypothetical protein
LQLRQSGLIHRDLNFVFQPPLTLTAATPSAVQIFFDFFVSKRRKYFSSSSFKWPLAPLR